MIVKDGKKWKLDIRPEGKNGKRVIRLYPTKADAKQAEQKILSAGLERSDKRTLNDLITAWYNLHGSSLKSSIDTKNRLLKISDFLKNPVAKKLTAEKFASYREVRIKAGIKEATLNRELSTLKALYNELRRLKVIDYQNPFSDIRKLKERKTELAYLDYRQINILLKECKKSGNESLYWVVRLSLATGGRWSEVERLRMHDFTNEGVIFVDTKNGQNRFVPLEETEYQNAISYLEKKKAFNPCYGAFRVAFKKTGITTPPGQLAHILRHTYASHFIMNGGSLRALQQLLGHSSLNVTMRYAHLSPDYLQQSVQYNPLSGWKESGKEDKQS